MKKIIAAIALTIAISFTSEGKKINGWASENHILDMTFGYGQNFLFNSKMDYRYNGRLQDFTNFSTWNITCAFFSYDFGVQGVYAGDVLGYPRFNYVWFNRISITPYDFEIDDFQISPFICYEWTATGTQDTSENTIGWTQKDYQDYSSYANNAPHFKTIGGGVQFRWFVSNIVSINVRFSVSPECFGSVFSASLWF